MASLPPVHDPDFASDSFQENLYAHYRDYLAHRPVFRSSDNVVYLTRHADCSALLGGKQFKRAAPGGNRPFGKGHDNSTALEEMVRHWMIFLDPPRHDVVRKAFTLPFTQSAVARLEPFVRERISGLLDRLPAGNRNEFLNSFAFLVPILVIAEILGVPTSDVGDFQKWSAQLTRSLDSATEESLREGTEVTLALNAYFADLLRRAPSLPEHSLIRMLHDDPAHGLTSAEVVSGLVFILMSGHETTKNLISSGLLLLAQHPDSYRRLREQPGLIPTAVEEMLRCDTPVQKFGRWTYEPAEFGGFEIPVGTYVSTLMGAANRDPLVFDDPDRFDIARTPNRHIAFGIGLHRCLGSILARMEGRLALEAVVSRYATLTPADHQWRNFSAFRSLDRLELGTTAAR